MNLAHLLHILTIVFITLKLTGHIAWSWWLVLAPSYGPAAVGLTLAGLGLLVYGIMWLFMSEEERNRERVTRALRAYRDALFRR